MGEQTVGNDVLGGTSGLSLHQCAEIACGKAALVGKSGYRRQTFALGFGVDIIVKQGDEFLHHAVVAFRRFYLRSVGSVGDIVFGIDILEERDEVGVGG